MKNPRDPLGMVAHAFESTGGGGALPRLAQLLDALERGDADAVSDWVRTAREAIQRTVDPHGRNMALVALRDIEQAIEEVNLLNRSLRS